MNDDIIPLFDLYCFIAIGISIWMAFKLEKRLKVRLPHTRPYKWGFYVGCMGVACAPIVLLVLLSLIWYSSSSRPSDNEGLFYVLIVLFWFLTHTICGFFIIKRKRLAWIVSTVLMSPAVLMAPLGWIINGIYANHRWQEFREESGSSPSSTVTRPGANAPAMPPPVPMDVPGTGVFFLVIRGQRQGPYTLGQLSTMWSSGHVPADTKYWQHGMTNWYPLIELLEGTK